MSKFISACTVSKLAVLGAIFLAPLMFTGAQASTTTKLLSCQANTKQKVVDCCERILRTNTRPYWISSGSGACGAAAVCSGGGKPPKTYAALVVVKPKKCSIYIPDTGSSDGSHDSPLKPDNGRNRVPGKN